MYKVRIIGAGSIGNHLANSFVNNNFEVEIADIDNLALERMINEIYPSRYGGWDERIKIIEASDNLNYKTNVLVIGTPPDTHLKVVLRQISLCSPNVILIEKPISHPDMTLFKSIEQEALKRNIRILVGYNHRLTENTLIATHLIKDKILGEILSITGQTRESWNGILNAHPWLKGPQDSYLSSYLRGGGALYEHSHALNLLQYFMEVGELSEVISVQATLDIVKTDCLNYDRFSFLSLINRENKVFHVIQDMVTNPPIKEIRVNGEFGDLIWRTSKLLDEVILFDSKGDLLEHNKIKKVRADDFIPEVLHIKSLLDGKTVESPLDYKYALTTMQIIKAAFESNSSGHRVTIT